MPITYYIGGAPGIPGMPPGIPDVSAPAAGAPAPVNEGAVIGVLSLHMTVKFIQPLPPGVLSIELLIALIPASEDCAGSNDGTCGIVGICIPDIPLGMAPPSILA